MFWGLKLTSGNVYHSIVEKSFHVSHAVLENAPELPGKIEVHVILHKVDYIICLLSESCLQHALNLEISEGEEMSVYVKSDSPHSCVHLTGYHIEESTDTQWEEEGAESWDEDESFDIDDERLDEILMNGTLKEDEEGDEDSACDYPSLSHLEQPSIHEVIEDEVDGEETKKSKKKKTKREQKKSKINQGENESKVKKRKRSQLEEVVEEEEEDQSLGILKKNKNKKKDALSEAGLTPKKKVTIKLPGEVTHSNEEEKTRIPSGLDEMTSKDIQQKTANCIKTFKNGLSIEEMSYGTGKIAKQGHKVHLRYKGHSTGDDGDKYEISKQDQPLVFTMGKGEVMPGLEQGVRGMKPGGVRRLIIPPSLRRKGDVPDCIANSANIVTIVKLLNITN